MKQIFKQTVVLILLLAMILPYSAFADSSITVQPISETPELQVLINGAPVDFEQYGVYPFIQNGRTLIPIKAVFEDMGAEVEYIKSVNKIIVTRGNSKITLTIGSEYAVIFNNGVRTVVKMEVPPKVVNGRTVVPMKYIGDALDSRLLWDQENYTALIIDAEHFYYAFENEPDKEILAVMDEAMKYVDKKYQDKIKAVKVQIQKDFKNELLVMDYADKIEEHATKGDKNAIVSLEYQISASTLPTEWKNDLKEFAKEAKDYITDNISEIAFKWVVQTEKSFSKEDYTIAMNAINNMPYSTERNDLLVRLNKTYVTILNVAKYKEAEEKVAYFAKYPTLENLNIAKVLIGALPSGTEKTNLTTIFTEQEKAFYYKDAENAVHIVELSRKIDDYTTALQKVSLVTSALKSELTKRLTAVEKEIYTAHDTQATEAVAIAEAQNTVASYNTATTLVDKMKSSTAKNNLIKRLADVKLVLDTEVLVVKAETSVLAVDVVNALTAVNKNVKNVTVKDSMTLRLSVVTAKIDKAKLLEATNAVVKAELSTIKPDYLVANTLVTALPTSADKTALVNRLNALVPIIVANYTAYVETLVVKAETVVTKANYDVAIEALKEVQDADKKATFTTRLSVVADKLLLAQIGVATTSVEKAEMTKLQADLDSARVLANGLPASEEKNALTVRLNELQVVIDLMVTGK